MDKNTYSTMCSLREIHLRFTDSLKVKNGTRYSTQMVTIRQQNSYTNIRQNRISSQKLLEETKQSILY